MVEKLAKDLVLRMSENQLINVSDMDYYEYAILSLVEHGITIVTILLLGMIFKQFIPTICFLIFFFALRKRTGGYHADKFWKCYLGTSIIYITVVVSASLLAERSVLLYGLLFYAVILIEVIGTINHPNLALDTYELCEAKKAARLVVLLELIIILTFIWLGLDKLYICYMSISIILCAVLLLLAKIIKQEVKEK